MRMQLSTNPRVGMPLFVTAPVADTTAPVATVTEPSGEGVRRTDDMNIAKLLFYGGADNTNCDAIIYGWAPVIGSDLWIPTVIARVGLVVGAAVGVIGQPVLASDNFVDTIVFVNGDDTVKIISGITDGIATVTVDLEGAAYIEVGFDFPVTTPSADMNAMVALL